MESIQKRFADAKTIDGRILEDYQEQMNKLIEDKLLFDFSFGLKQLDGNLQQYIGAIVKNLILLQNHNYNDLDSSVSFSLNLQNALENILKLDKESRSIHYEKVFKELEIDFIDSNGKTWYYKDHDYFKKDKLNQIYRSKLFSNSTLPPLSLINVCKGYLSRGNSLLSYLASFILTYSYDNKSVLFKILKDRIELFIEVAQLRNEKGHGQTSNEKALKPISKAELEKYYNFIKSLINNYIQNN